MAGSCLCDGTKLKSNMLQDRRDALPELKSAAGRRTLPVTFAATRLFPSSQSLHGTAGKYMSGAFCVQLADFKTVIASDEEQRTSTQFQVVILFMILGGALT